MTRVEVRARELDGASKALREAREAVSGPRLEALKAENPVDLLGAAEMPKGKPREWTRGVVAGIEKFASLVEYRDELDMDLVVRYVTQDSRTVGRKHASSYARGNSINLTRDGGQCEWTVVHELGHWLEQQDTNVLEAAREFYARRTKGEDLPRLNTYGSGYAADEWTRRDAWLDPYAGKDYAGRATELVSMGVQFLVKDPLWFAEGDPEHFRFTIRALKGWY
jgi:hypothetical protein